MCIEWRHSTVLHRSDNFFFSSFWDGNINYWSEKEDGDINLFTKKAKYSKINPITTLNPYSTTLGQPHLKKQDLTLNDSLSSSLFLEMPTHASLSLGNPSDFPHLDSCLRNPPYQISTHGHATGYIMHWAALINDAVYFVHHLFLHIMYLVADNHP